MLTQLVVNGLISGSLHCVLNPERVLPESHRLMKMIRSVAKFIFEGIGGKSYLGGDGERLFKICVYMIKDNIALAFFFYRVLEIHARGRLIRPKDESVQKFALTCFLSAIKISDKRKLQLIVSQIILLFCLRNVLAEYVPEPLAKIMGPSVGWGDYED